MFRFFCKGWKYRWVGRLMIDIDIFRQSAFNFTISILFISCIYIIWFDFLRKASDTEIHRTTRSQFEYRIQQGISMADIPYATRTRWGVSKFNQINRTSVYIYSLAHIYIDIVLQRWHITAETKYIVFSDEWLFSNNCKMRLFIQIEMNIVPDGPIDNT